MRSRPSAPLALAIVLVHALAAWLALRMRAPAPAPWARGTPGARLLAQPAAFSRVTVIPLQRPAARELPRVPEASHALPTAGGLPAAPADGASQRMPAVARAPTRPAAAAGAVVTPVPARPRDPASPAAAAPSPAGRPWPRYATRPPPSLSLAGRVRLTLPSGDAHEGPARLTWMHEAAGYHLQVDVAPEGRPPRLWASDGVVDAAGLAPRQLIQRDGDRLVHRVTFDPAARSAPAAPAGATDAAGLLAPGAQDRWSWLAQLASILEAATTPPAVVHLQVAGLHGELERYSFRIESGARAPPGAASASARAHRLLQVTREPDAPYGLRVQAWLDPALHHFPVEMRLTTPPAHWAFDLQGMAEGLNSTRQQPTPPQPSEQEPIP